MVFFEILPKNNGLAGPVSRRLSCIFHLRGTLSYLLCKHRNNNNYMSYVSVYHHCLLFKAFESGLLANRLTPWSKVQYHHIEVVIDQKKSRLDGRRRRKPALGRQLGADPPKKKQAGVGKACKRVKNRDAQLLLPKSEALD